MKSCLYRASESGFATLLRPQFAVCRSRRKEAQTSSPDGPELNPSLVTSTPTNSACRSRREEAQTTSAARNEGGPSLLTSAPTALIRAVAEAAREVRRVRAGALRSLKGGLRALYRTLELPGANPLKDAHAALDAAVLAAYGFDPKQDLLAQLLALNLAVAAKIDHHEPVTAPGLPPGFPEPEKLVTEDCIRP